ncbi:MAG: ABC transporter substrate-binding protein, partial [Candidatus Coproplasma sp.]
VSLRHDLKFDNGEAITAHDFVHSIELLLDPDAANYRADSLYGGQFSLVNAEKYVKQGSYAYTAMVSAEYLDEEYFDPANLVADENDVLQLDGKDAVLNINDGGNWGSNGLAKYYEYHYFNVEGWEELAAKADEDGYVKLDAAGLLVVQNAIAQLHGYDDVEKYAEDAGDYAYMEWEEMCYFGQTWEDGIPFSEVGVKAVDDYTIDFIIEKPLSGFYLNYNLASSMYLVNTAKYESCISTSAGVYTNNYGTSVDTYVGFGPYRLVTFTADSIATFEKNPYWWGYTSGEHAGEYQTTNISIQQVPEASTRLQMFLAGQLDTYGLQKADMEDYQQSDYTYFTEGDSTWFIALNPSMSGLTAAQETATPSATGKVVNKTVLTIKEFRQALSFSVDRAAYELALDPLGSPAKALYGNMIISDPDNGVAYRTTDEAKQVIVDFWGLTDEIGEGKDYETIDDAIASITGYDLAGAKKLFDEAYAIAVEQELIDPDTDWEVQIVIGQPGSGSSAYYNDGYVLLKQVWTEAVKGTAFEGRLVFSQSQPLGSSSFSTYLKNNSVDILFGVGWTGSALDPYNLMEAYVSPNYQYDPGWDTTSTMLDIEIDGKVLRASVYEWGKDALQGNDIEAKVVVNGEVTSETVTINAGTSADASLRLKILAAVEGAVLQQYDMIPVGLEASASLKSMRINFYTEEYVFGMGRGGLQYYTFKMNDADWAAYVSAQGGTLNYK